MRRALLLLLLLAPTLGADEVILAGGGRLSGEILEETESGVLLRLPNGTMLVPRARVAQVVREEPGAYLRREAQGRLDGGGAGTAVALLERALALHPDDAPARRLLVEALRAHARALAAAHRHAEAREALARLQELEPGDAEGRSLAALVAAEERDVADLLARARQALRAGNEPAALLLLEACRRLLPESDPRAREELAVAHLAAGAAARAEGALRQALDHYRLAAAYGAVRETGEPLLLLAPVAVLEALDEGDLERAARLLDSIASRYPEPAVPVFLGAVLSHVSGRVEEAVKRYADAARLAEERGGGGGGLSYEVVRSHARATLRSAIARPPEEGVAAWREVFLGPLASDDSAPYFTVYAATAQEARDVATAAAAAYERIVRELLGAVPEAPRAEVVVHPTREAYLAADTSPPGTPLAPLTISREQTRGVCYDTLDAEGRPLIRIEIDVEEPVALTDTLPHEVVHLVQRQGLKAFRKGHWFDEGLATLYESDAGRANRAALWRQLRESRLPLPEFLELYSTPPDKAAVYYLQAHAFTVFLKGLGGDEEWSRFLAAFGAGTLEEAVRTAYGVESLADLERRWELSTGTP